MLHGKEESLRCSTEEVSWTSCYEYHQPFLVLPSSTGLPYPTQGPGPHVTPQGHQALQECHSSPRPCWARPTHRLMSQPSLSRSPGRCLKPEVASVIPNCPAAGWRWDRSWLPSTVPSPIGTHSPTAPWLCWRVPKWVHAPGILCPSHLQICVPWSYCSQHHICCIPPPGKLGCSPSSLT